MDDTMAVTLDEICALASKIDAGEPLDGDDQMVMRALLVLAGERVAELGQDANEVDGFAFDFGAPGVDGTVGLSFPVTEFSEKSSPKLFLHCCTGKHIPTGKLTV